MKKKKIWEMKIHYELLKHCQYSFYNLRLSPIDCTIYYEVMLLVGVFFFFFFFFLKKKFIIINFFFMTMRYTILIVNGYDHKVLEQKRVFWKNSVNLFTMWLLRELLL
jgi:hypothetical protein